MGTKTAKKAAAPAAAKTKISEAPAKAARKATKKSEPATPVILSAGATLGRMMAERGVVDSFDLSKRSGISVKVLRRILGGGAPSVEQAFRLSLVFSTSATYWLDLQNQYDLDKLQKNVGLKIMDTVKPISEPAKAA